MAHSQDSIWPWYVEVVPLSKVEVKPLLILVGRRYFRYLKFIDCFSIANEAFQKFVAGEGILSLLEFGKWSCLGMYLTFEATTIVCFLLPFLSFPSFAV